ncbi:MAG: cytochrome b/b6 domain-containing protein [Bacteroidia bacterium]|nr:cytochrome b/b6 domain-containing protein [Bacteroidia bacterium]
MEQTKYSKVYRIIHWATAISFILLLLTIFLRLTWLNKFNVAAIIQDYLSGTDQVLSQEQLTALAKKIRQPMWDWHMYIGEFGPKELKKSMESIHVLGTYYLVAFIGLHLGGVLMAEFTSQKGIISRIISGTKD